MSLGGPETPRFVRGLEGTYLISPVCTELMKKSCWGALLSKGTCAAREKKPNNRGRASANSLCTQ